MSRSDEPTAGVLPTSLSIHSLLINPALPSGSSARPGARDIPPTYLSHLPPASIGDFSTYIAQFGDQYDRYIRSKRLVLQQHLAALDRDVRTGDGASTSSNTDAYEARLARQIDGYGSVSNFSRLSLDDTRSMISEGADLGSPSLENELNGEFGHIAATTRRLPEVFAAENFDLKNPRTFDIACEGLGLVAEYVDEKATRRVTQQTTVLQDLLSDHMDLVERQLVDEVSAVGPVFFSALQDLRELESLAAMSLAALESLRQDYAKLQHDRSAQGLGQASLVSAGERVACLRRNILAVEQRVSGGRQLCQAIAQDDPIEATTALWQAFSESKKLSPVIAAVPIVERVDVQAEDAWQRYLRRGQDSLLRHLIGDVEAVVAQADVATVLQNMRLRYLRKRPESAASTTPSIEPVRASIEADIRLLVTTRGIDAGLSEYRDGIVRMAKAITKNHLPASDENDSVASGATQQAPVQKTAALSKALRALAPEDFADMLENICVQTCTFLRRVQTHQKLLTDLLTRLPDEIGAESWQVVSSQDLLNTLIDVTQGRLGKVLNVRSEENSILDANIIRRLFVVVRVFVSECESLTGSNGQSLLAICDRQLLASTAKLCAAKTSNLAKAVETDSWQALKTIGRSTDAAFSSLTSIELADAESWLVESDLENDLEVQLEGRTLTASAAHLIGTLHVEMSLGYHVVPCRNTITSSIIEQLRLFNSRACQLILGAGATKSAGLERITAKHLAVAAESLRNIASLLPGIKQLLLKLAPRSQANDLDKVRAAYDDHIGEIHEKLVSIMADRAAAVCGQVANVQWPSRSSRETTVAPPAASAVGPDGVDAGTGTHESAPGDSAAAGVETSTFMTTLIKDTLVLYRVINRLLPAETVSDIMHRVVELERQKLVLALADIRATSEDAKVQIDWDLDQFVNRVGQLAPRVTLAPFFS